MLFAIDFEESYLGTLLFRDAAICRLIYNLLQNHIGASIKEIGDLDLFRTL
jgi:hypothetical protein